LPTATIHDAEVACVLNRVVRLINPVVDVLSRADPLGLKGRSHHLFGDDDASVDKVLDALAWVITRPTFRVRRRGRTWTSTVGPTGG
jgi:hypothetical protein